MSEIELHCDENKSKNETQEKSLFKSDLKVIRTNRYKLKSLIRLNYKSRENNCLSLSGIQRNEDKHRQNKKNPQSFAR